jgi:hypothetical protein
VFDFQIATFESGAEPNVSVSDANTYGNLAKSYSIIDFECLLADFLQLPIAACHELGPSTLTLSAIIRLSDFGNSASTFQSISTIAAAAMLPVGTVKRQIKKCVEISWIASRGRELLSKSKYRRRRTNTLVLTTKCVGQRNPFLPLPRWAAGYLATWAEMVLLASVVNRHGMLESVGAAENHGREQMSINELMRQTGLAKHSVIDAKHRLSEAGVILIDHDWDSTDELRLNPDFEVKASAIPAPIKGSAKVRPLREEGVSGDSAKVDQTPSAKVRPAWCKSAPEVVQKCAGGSAKVRRLINENCEGKLLNGKLLNKTGLNENTAASADGANLFSDQGKILFSKAKAEAIYTKVQARGVKTSTTQQRKELKQLCCLVAAERLCEHWVVDSAEAVDKCRPDEPLSYFWKVLREHAAKSNVDINALLRIPLEADSISSTPQASEYAKKLAEQFTSKPESADGAW